MGAGRVKKTGDANYRIQFEEGQRNRRIIEIDLAMLYLFQQIAWKCIYIYLQANGQGGLRTDSRAYSTKLGSLDGLIQFQRVAPERLITKCVETEDFLALFHLLGGILNRGVFAHARCTNRWRAANNHRTCDQYNRDCYDRL